jgi:hypothetical protein
VTLENIADAQEQGNKQVSLSKNNKFTMFRGGRIAGKILP